ncbi:MAG: DsbA family protein [Myxococcota bacterium]
MQNGSATVLAAVILGLSVLGGAYLVGSSVDRAAVHVASLSTAVGKVQLAAAAAPSAPSPAPSRGPDPKKAYKINIAGSPSRGGGDGAKVTVVEFSDFQCPFCGRVNETLDQVEEAYGEDVRIVFKHLPLRMHKQAPLAHAAAEAANKQGKFWERHDLIFENQRQLTEAKFIEYAGQIDIDVEQFKVDLKSPAVKKRVDADAAEASKLGVTGTPGFFVNGYFLSGARPFSDFKRAIDEQAKEG